MNKKLKHLHIKNFQSHTDTKIDIAEYFTAIVGPSDSGKSAIIRALRWVLFNEPSGTHFFRIGEEEASVLVEFTDNSSLLRVRNKKENYYLIKYKNKESLRLEGFGRGVPEEVIEFTGIKKVKIGDNDALTLNIAGQLENAFLLTESPSSRADTIGKLAGTDKINRASRVANNDKRYHRQRINEIKVEQEILEKKIKELDYLNHFRKQIEEIKKLEKVYLNKANKIDSLKLLLIKFNSNNKEISNKEKEIEMFYSLKNAKNYLSDLEKITKNFNKIFDFNKKRIQINKELAHYTPIKNNNKEFLDYIEEKKPIKILNRMSNLKRIQKTYNLNKKAFKMNKKLAYIDDNLMKLIYNEVLEKRENFIKLQELQEIYINNKKSLNIGVKYTKQFNYLDDAKKENESLIELKRKLDKLSKIQRRYKDINNKIIKEKENNKDILYQLKNYNKKYIKLFENIKQCPFCLSKLNYDNINYLKNFMEKEYELRK